MRNTSTAIISGIVLSGFVACSGGKPAAIGIKENKLHPCPDSPNCVSSFEKDEKHGIAPLAFTDSPAEAMTRLKKIIWNKPRTSIITENEKYIHVTFTSMFFRFVDDVEFLMDSQNKIIHVRSASRKGYSDLGVNRKRIEEIRTSFSKK